jgi:hypothetical protein
VNNNSSVLYEKSMFYAQLLSIGMSFLFASVTQLYGAQNKKMLRDFRVNHYSQWGEDGIIQKIFQIIGTTSKVCIEFGAWDGLKYSNTAHLWKTQNWKAILIEADSAKFEELLKNTKGYSCININRFVGIGRDNSLEAILAQHGITDSIDLLSIDIDSDDYQIFAGLNKLHPRVIICEHNPTIPAELDIYQDYGGAFGCSIGALIRIASAKGYSLVALTETNSIFVDSSLIGKFAEFELSPANIAVTDYVKYLIFSYAGMPVIVGKAPNTGFAFEIHNQGYPAKLHHKQEILRVKNLVIEWPPAPGNIKKGESLSE